MKYYYGGDRHYSIGSIEEVYLNLIKEIDRIDAIMKDIENHINDLKPNFTGDVANAFYEKFNNIDSEYKTIKDNLNTYADSLLKIKETYHYIDEQEVKKMENMTDELVSNQKASMEANLNQNR